MYAGSRLRKVEAGVMMVMMNRRVESRVETRSGC